MLTEKELNLLYDYLEDVLGEEEKQKAEDLININSYASDFIADYKDLSKTLKSLDFTPKKWIKSNQEDTDDIKSQTLNPIRTEEEAMMFSLSNNEENNNKLNNQIKSTNKNSFWKGLTAGLIPSLLIGGIMYQTSTSGAFRNITFNDSSDLFAQELGMLDSFKIGENPYPFTVSGKKYFATKIKNRILDGNICFSANVYQKSTTITNYVIDICSENNSYEIKNIIKVK